MSSERDIVPATAGIHRNGAMAAILAVLCFSLNDILIKYLSGDYALHQIILIRTLVGLSFLLAVIVPLEGGPKSLIARRPFLHLLRGLCVVLANTSFFLALAVLPYADATGVFFISPLLITAMGALILGERVGLRRWLAVLIGLVGVIIMLNPGTEMQIALFLPLFAAFSYAMLHMLTRRIGVADSAAAMSFYIAVSFLVVSTVVGLIFGDGAYAGRGPDILHFLLRPWVWPPAGDWIWLCLIGMASISGGYFISQAYRTTEASLIAPLEYTALPVAIFADIVIFATWPDLRVWLGILLIAGAGLFVFRRENRARATSHRR